MVHDFSNVWAIQVPVLQTIAAKLAAAPSEALVAKLAAPRKTAPDARVGVALIDVVGPLFKFDSWLVRWLGGTATKTIGDQIRAAAADPSVHAIMLRVDSPGGMVPGTSDLADLIAQVSATKPVHGYIEDLGASAAYWLASQCKTLACGPSAAVGSIGVYAVVADWSAAFDRAGVKVHVIRAGEFKGAGAAGTEVTKQHLAEWQRIIDRYADLLIDAVARGRRLSAGEVRGLADGRLHVGSDAKRLGLADAVESFDEAFARVAAEASEAAARVDAIARDVSTYRERLAAAEQEYLRAGNSVESARALAPRRVAYLDPGLAARVREHLKN